MRLSLVALLPLLAFASARRGGGSSSSSSSDDSDDSSSSSFGSSDTSSGSSSSSGTPTFGFNSSSTEPSGLPSSSSLADERTLSVYPACTRQCIRDKTQTCSSISCACQDKAFISSIASCIKKSCSSESDEDFLRDMLGVGCKALGTEFDDDAWDDAKEGSAGALKAISSMAILVAGTVVVIGAQ